MDSGFWTNQKLALAGIGLAFLGVAVGIAQWLIPADMVAYQIRLGFVALAGMLLVAGLVLLGAAFRPNAKKQSLDPQDHFQQMADRIYPNSSYIKQALGMLPTQEQLNKRRLLLDLRTEGVGLHNKRVLAPAEYEPWRQQYEDWHLRMLEAANALDPELKAMLSPLRDLPAWNKGWPINSDHRLAQNMIWEMLARLERYLDQTR